MEGQEKGAEMYQVLVKNLDGRTRCLRFSTKEVLFEDLKAELTVSEGIPGVWQRIVSGTRELVAGSSLVADASGIFPSCTLLSRLRGGKGGFGSLLRGAATKAGQKKTSNFDACRDMSGRRLRHVNAEKKLKEWKAEAKERDLEKTAEEFLRKRRKVEEEQSGVEVDLEKFRNESLNAREEVASAVTDGLVEAGRLALDLKRKKVEAVEVDAKKPRLRLPGDSDLENSEDEKDSDAEDEGGASGSEKDEGGPSGSEKDEGGPSPSGANTWNKDPIEASTSGSSEAEEDQPHPSTSGQRSETSPSASSGVDESTTLETKEASPSLSEKEEASQPESIVKDEINSSGGLSRAVETPSSDSRMPAGPLNMDDYKSAKDLEVLGLDRLKEELQKVGLKCGGSLQERAARLWLLRTVPLEKLDKKLFSKPPKK